MKGWSFFRGVLFGGNANNSANAGFANANSNNTPSNANTNIGSQLCLRTKRLWNDGLASWRKISELGNVLVEVQLYGHRRLGVRKQRIL